MPVITRKEVTVTVAAAGSNGEATVDVNGLLRNLELLVPELDETDTAELVLHTADDAEIFASGEKAHVDSAITGYYFKQDSGSVAVECALWGTTTVRVECSGAQAAEREFTVYLYMEGT